MSFRFNAPPGWPTPPEGWMPPPGWRANPAWPPAPAGWQFYVEELPSYLDDVPLRRPSVDPMILSPGGCVRQRPGRRTWAARHKVLIGSGAAVLVLVGATAYGSNGSTPSTITTVVASSSAPVTTPPITVPRTPPSTPATTATLPPTTSAIDPTATPATVAPSATASVKNVAPSRIPTTSTRPPRTARTTAALVGPKPGSPIASGPLCGAPPNPFGYTFCGGRKITAAAPNVCRYFPCIPSFWEGQGYLIQCQDGMFSLSGGRRGACSSHHGVRRSVLREK